MLDVMHHLPGDAVPNLLQECHRALANGGVLVLKDVETSSALKTAFTWTLDRAMVGLRAPITYWSKEQLIRLLEQVGFEVYQHSMVDYLPFPHMIYICRKRLG